MISGDIIIALIYLAMMLITFCANVSNLIFQYYFKKVVGRYTNNFLGKIAHELENDAILASIFISIFWLILLLYYTILFIIKIFDITIPFVIKKFLPKEIKVKIALGLIDKKDETKT